MCACVQNFKYVINEGLTQKLIPEGYDNTSYGDIWEKSSAGKGKSKSKCPHMRSLSAIFQE